MHDKVFKVKEFYLKGEGVEELTAIKCLFEIDEDALYAFILDELYIGYETSYKNIVINVPVKNKHIMSLKVYLKDLDVIKKDIDKDGWFRFEDLEYILKDDPDLCSCDMLFLDSGEYPSDDYTRMSVAYAIGHAWFDIDGELQYSISNKAIKPKWCRFIKF